VARFLSGPPGGRTLPQTPTRLSDLSGGIYGPGASVASTGLNAQRASIKAGITRAAGETWEDILEYYLVCLPCRTFSAKVSLLSE
jgi:SEL1 protein